MRFLVVALGLVVNMAANVSGVYAEKIYKYEAENGTLLFTNRNGDNGKLISVEQAEVYEPKSRVDIQKYGNDYDFTVSGYNEYFGPAEIFVTLEQSKNYTSNFGFPHSFVLNARERRDLFRMWVVDSKLSSASTYTTTVVPGDPRAIHDDNVAYALPIAVSDFGPVYISQAFHGRTHSHIQSRHAIDIPAPEGTKVRAARSGVVMDIANDYFRGGSTDKLMDRANFVRILHDDGTMGLYAHLKFESAQVKMGDRVRVGQVIAQVGSTGFSDGPHLHFVVQKNFGKELRSIPFRLQGPDGTGVVPAEGMIFR